MTVTVFWRFKTKIIVLLKSIKTIAAQRMHYFISASTNVGMKKYSKFVEKVIYLFEKKRAVQQKTKIDS